MKNKASVDYCNDILIAEQKGILSDLLQIYQLLDTRTDYSSDNKPATD